MMFGALFDFFGGKKLKEKIISLRQGTLKIILKNRNNEKYVYMRFSYPGNVQYHALHLEDIDETIETLIEFRKHL